MKNEIGKSVARNTVVMLGAQLITWISSFILLLFLPRYLGSAQYGQLYLAISIAMILSVVIDFGGKFLIPKEVAQDKGKTAKILVSYIGVRSIIWTISLCFFIVFAFIVDYSSTIKWLILILGITKLWEGLSKAIRSCFQGHEMMEYPSIGVIVQKVFVSVAAVTALFLGAGPIPIALIMMVGVLGKLAVNMKFVPTIVESIPEFRIDISLDLIKTSIPYFLWSIFGVIYYRIDTVMLSVFTNESVVGWYGGAYRFFDVIMFLPSIFATVVFPIFSKLDTKKQELTDTFQRSFRYMILSGIPMSICFFLFAENIVQLFYGLEEYAPSVFLLQVFAPGILLVYIDFVLGSTIMATDKQRALAWIGFIAILINIGLNFLAIPYTQNLWSNGGIGAAITTVVTELFIMVAASSLLREEYFQGYSWSLSALSVISGIAMFAIVWVLNALSVFWMVQALLGILFYLVCVIFLKVITKNELRFFKEFLSDYQFLSMLKPNKEQI